MRGLLLAVLLAGAATPAFAADNEERGQGRRGAVADEPVERVKRAKPGDADRSERQEVRIERRRQNVEIEAVTVIRREGSNEQALTGGRSRSLEARVEPSEAGDAVRAWRVREQARGDTPAVVERRSLRRLERIERSPDVEEREIRRTTTVERSAQLEERIIRHAPGEERSGGFVQPRRPLPRVLDPNPRRVDRAPIFGTQPPEPPTATIADARPSRRWSTDWRRDRRYNWWDWRRRHRSLFRLGFYDDPFGWDYFRYGIGWRLWPSYYHRSFWLHDPWHWRLPHGYGPYRWIRYHNDALLVNIYTGRVVDVIYGFFW